MARTSVMSVWHMQVLSDFLFFLAVRVILLMLFYAGSVRDVLGEDFYSCALVAFHYVQPRPVYISLKNKFIELLSCPLAGGERFVRCLRRICCF